MANGCDIDNGTVLGCSSIGGVESVWIGTYDGDATYTLGTASEVIGATNANTVYKFEMDIEFGGLSQNGQYSRENGTVFYESTLSVKFIELNNDLRNTMIALGRAPIYAIIKSNAGHYYILGVESAGRATESTAGVGVAQGDINGVTMTFTWKSANGMYVTDSTIFQNGITVG